MMQIIEILNKVVDFINAFCFSELPEKIAQAGLEITVFDMVKITDVAKAILDWIYPII